MTDRDPARALHLDNPAIRRVRDGFGRQGLVGTLGAWLVELQPGRAVIEIPFSNRVAGQSGRFHAAVVAGIAQACGGCAAATLAADGVDIAPGSFGLTYDGSTEGDLLRAECTAVADGATHWKAQVHVTCRNQGVVTRCASASLIFEIRQKPA